MSQANNLSVVIITLNEEHNLPRLLRSLPRGSEVFILDSGSTDKTCQIATDHGATVKIRGFVDYSDQKNAAIELATRPWVLSMDADEELCEEAREALFLTSITGRYIAFFDNGKNPKRSYFH